MVLEKHVSPDNRFFLSLGFHFFLNEIQIKIYNPLDYPLITLSQIGVKTHVFENTF